MEAVIDTNRGRLVRGQRVPWITRWSSEVVTPGPRIGLRSFPGGATIAFHDETPADRVNGVLWLRENNSPGEGNPIWAEVHSARQRECQVEGRCQVCGQKPEGPLLWLIPMHLSRRNHGNITTDVAPVCEPCHELALVRCPALSRSTSTLYEVRNYRPWAVTGDMLKSENGQLVHTRAEVLLGSTDINHIMARQMVVELWDFRKRTL